MDDDREKDKKSNLATYAAKNVVKKEAKLVAKRTTLTTAASTAPVWIPILIVVLIFVFVFIVVLIPFLPGGSQNNDVGFLITPTPEASPSATIDPSATPPPKTEIPNCDQVDGRLRTDFNITVSGTSCGIKQTAYAVYASMFRSTRYKQLVNRAGNVRAIFTSGPCAGRTYGNWFRIGSCNNVSSRYMFIHEMGHVIRNYNYATVRTGFNHTLLQQQDRNCYDRGFLKTYLLRSGGITAKSESFAEAMTLYIINRKGGYYVPSQGYYGRPIYNFKQECPNTYRAIKDNFFGGYEFN